MLPWKSADFGGYRLLSVGEALESVRAYWQRGHPDWIEAYFPVFRDSGTTYGRVKASTGQVEQWSHDLGSAELVVSQSLRKFFALQVECWLERVSIDTGSA